MTETFKNIEKSKYFSEDDITRGPKKFVFQIYPENIKFIESLSYQEKQDFINDLITENRQKSSQHGQKKKRLDVMIKAVIFALVILIGIPLFFYLASMSLDVTRANYAEMQRNFGRLY